ncbi:MAG: tetratricopeptide repeat protein, partial [Gammaproteobacteria bacterium]
QNQLDAAVSHYHAALALDPALAPAHNNLGGIYQALGDMEKAGSCYRNAIKSDPELAEAHRNYAAVLEIKGETVSALHHYREALRINPGYDEVAFKIAALNGDNAPAAAPSEYVAGLFDQYAEEFDHHLTGTLGYRTPQLLREMFDRLAEEPGFIRILDLGCGTGLSGEAFRECASHMAGVDLSPRMIDKAKARGIYHELHCGDVVQALKRDTQAWDLILAVDVLVYIGDLGGFMPAAANALRPGGWLLFSVEKSTQGNFVLGKSGRYAHNLEYLQLLASQAGLNLLEMEETVLRQDYGNDVMGYLLMMQKP